MNTGWMCAPNDLNTYPMCDLQACFGGLSTYFVNIKVFFEGKRTGFNNNN